jgi:hypothetical protein
MIPTLTKESLWCGICSPFVLQVSLCIQEVDGSTAFSSAKSQIPSSID